MLLTHSAGFPNFRFLNPDGKLDIKFAPGSRYAYPGEGINLLQQRVFDRFGLTRTSMTWKPEMVKPQLRIRSAGPISKKGTTTAGRTTRFRSRTKRSGS